MSPSGGRRSASAVGLPEGCVGVKVCGVTRVDQADACVRAGVWGIGLVFAPASPRVVDLATAAAIAAAVGPEVARVGVFVEPDPTIAVDIARRVGLSHIQVHGNSDPEAIRAAGPEFAVIEGVRMSGAEGVARARASRADLVLVDAAVAGAHGGTGVTFDWRLVADGALGRPFALAGGLTPGNVAEAVTRVGPALVDVSSGVESAPGQKDPGLVDAFMAQVRAAVAA